MESGDKIQDQFGFENDHEYIARLRKIVTLLNKMVDEVEAAQGSGASLVEAFSGFLKKSGLTADLEGGGFEVKNIANATDPASAVPLQQLTSIAALGTADPSTINVTSFSAGSLSDGDVLQLVGTALQGLNITTLIQSLATEQALTSAVNNLNQTMTNLAAKVADNEALAVAAL